MDATLRIMEYQLDKKTILSEAERIQMLILWLLICKQMSKQNN